MRVREIPTRIGLMDLKCEICGIRVYDYNELVLAVIPYKKTIIRCAKCEERRRRGLRRYYQ